MNTLVRNFFQHLYPRKNLDEIMRQYHIPSKLNIQIRITSDGWFVVTSPDLPGLITQAKTQQELLGMLNDAILTYFDVPKRKANIIFNKLDIEGLGTVEYKGQLRTA